MLEDNGKIVDKLCQALLQWASIKLAIDQIEHIWIRKIEYQKIL